MSDDLTPFAYGAIYGTRSWFIDDDGYLTGIIYQQRWLPGENVATCRASFVERTLSTGASWISRQPIDDTEPGTPITPGHMIECGPRGGQGMGGCGFHAFLEGSNDYRAYSGASGVVALYGRGVRGTRGGRFMKARIVALHLPRYPFEGPFRKDTSRSHALRHKLYPTTLTPGCCEPDPGAQDRYERVRSRYPGIPLYDTWDEMLRHHPTTPAMTLQEES